MKPPYAKWNDHDLLVESVTRLGFIDKHLEKQNGTISEHWEHLDAHSDRLKAIEVKMCERTRYGWPSNRKLFGGGTLLVVVGTIAGSAIARAIDVWPF